MKYKSNHIRNICLLVFCLGLFGCTSHPSSISKVEVIVSEIPATKIISTPTIFPTNTETPTNDVNNLIITPDAVFSFPTLETSNLPNPAGLCKQVPAPRVVESNKELFLSAGVFSLCVLHDQISAFDLDHGIFVDPNDRNADIQLRHSKSTLDSKVFYYLKAINNAHIDEIDTNELTINYCQNKLQALKRPGIFIIEPKAIACVLTTQGDIGLIRAESMNVYGVESVEFSFVIFKK